MSTFDLTQLIDADVPHLDLTITSNPVDPFEKMLEDLLQSSLGKDFYNIMQSWKTIMLLHLNSPETSNVSQEDNPPDRRFNSDDVTGMNDLNPCDTAEMDGN